MQALNDRHKELMEKSLRFKEEILDKYIGRIKDNLDEEKLKAFVILADSLENNITKSAKLDLMKEKNDIDRANGRGLVEVFRQIQERKVREHQERLNQKSEEEEVSFEPTGIEVSSGEVINGQDEVDYDIFLAGKHI